MSIYEGTFYQICQGQAMSATAYPEHFYFVPCHPFSPYLFFLSMDKKSNK